MTEKQTNTTKGKQKENGAWETIPDEGFYRFDAIGNSLQGVLSEKGKSEKYDVGMYDIDTENGTIRFLGKTQLDRQLKNIDIGDYICITYVDDMSTPNGQMKIFEVKRKKTV
jgi:hypothetical protein